MRRAAKTDNNHAFIRDQLRKNGRAVWDCSKFGEGFPDLVVGYRGSIFLMEIKSEDGTLTAMQTRAINKWEADGGEPVLVVYELDEAITMTEPSRKEEICRRLARNIINEAIKQGV